MEDLRAHILGFLVPDTLKLHSDLVLCAFLWFTWLRFGAN